MRANRLSGHTLPCEGRVQLGGFIIGDGSGEGRAACSCGTESELLPSTRARRKWHHDHKNDIRSELGLCPDEPNPGGRNPMTTRSFHLGDILTVTTGALVSPRHMEGVYDVLNWMTGDNLFTHQLPRAGRECQPHLLAQHPDLAGVEVPKFSDTRPVAEAEVAAWLADQVTRFGEYRDVAPLTEGDHTVIDPLAEMAMSYPHVKVIGVAIDPAGGDDR